MKRSVWAIADTHLGFTVDKPMDIFGTRWEDHTERLAENWRTDVKSDDVVLLPGDISWGMSFEESAADLRYLHELPGTKILGKGNHDYWWQTQRKNEIFVEEHGFDSIYFLYNNAHRIDLDATRTVIIVGTRGWLHPLDWEGEHDEKIYERELGRFELSFQAGKKLEKAALAEGREVTRLAMLHYPTRLSHPKDPTPFDQLLQESGISICLYGHLHGSIAHKRGARGDIDGVQYINVAADALAFSPRLIL